MTARSAWFCPACQKHHAPHVETCPGQKPKGLAPWPSVQPWMPTREEPAIAAPALPDWMKQMKVTNPCGGKGVCGNVACPNRMVITCASLGAVQ